MRAIRKIRYTYSGADDVDIAWAMHVYNNDRQLEMCLTLIRQAYQSSRIVIISDGDNRDYTKLAIKFKCTYVAGAHLMSLATGHEYVTRLLRCFIEGPETYMIKIDPDTCVWRRLEKLPEFSCMFGTIETLSEGLRSEIQFPANIQGGCIGMTRDVVQELLESNVLDAAAISEAPERTWARCGDMARVIGRNIISDDFVLTWAAGQLGIPIVEAPEIRSRWRMTPDNSDRRYAVTHPHKFFER